MTVPTILEIVTISSRVAVVAGPEPPLLAKAREGLAEFVELLSEPHGSRSSRAEPSAAGAVTTVPDPDGLPAAPCLVCGDGLFWCPAGQPPEFAAWLCYRYAPPPPGLQPTACALPA